MPVRVLTGFEKKINQCRDGPAPRIQRRIAKGFAEITAFWMRMQIEQADNAGGFGRRWDRSSLRLPLPSRPLNVTADL
jgi:hypothetical protein